MKTNRITGKSAGATKNKARDHEQIGLKADNASGSVFQLTHSKKKQMSGLA